MRTKEIEMSQNSGSMKRRDFLKIGATGLAGVCAGGLALPRTAFAEAASNSGQKS